MEAHLKAIGLWIRILGMLPLLDAARRGARLLVSQAQSGDVYEWLGSTLAAATIAALIYWLGHALYNYSDGARIVTVGIIALAMVLQVFGFFSELQNLRKSSHATISLIILVIIYPVEALLLCALFNRRSMRICSPEYAASVAATPHLTPAPVWSPFFWVPLIFIGLLAILAWEPW